MMVKIIGDYDYHTSFLVNFPLSVNQICGHINEVQNTVDWRVPIFQQILLILNWPEVNSAINSVNSAWNSMIIVQST